MTTIEPMFSNRHRTFRLLEGEGGRLLECRPRPGRVYPDHVVEALEVVRADPCRWMPRVHEVSAERVVVEYLEGFGPLSKAGVTSARLSGVNLRKHRRGRFRRRHLMPYLRDMAAHWDRFLEQMRQTGAYLAEHGLWHDDVIPQNVMWHLERSEMRLVDIEALMPRRLIDEGVRLPYTRRRQRGVFRLDGTVDEVYLREVFLQDLAPWWRVWLRKAGVGRVEMG